MRVQGSPKFVAQIRRIVAHEYYNARNFDYDVALLQLKTAWPDSLSHLIQPVCIPALAQPLQPGDRCWVTGWGSMSEGGEQTNEPGDTVKGPLHTYIRLCIYIYMEVIMNLYLLYFNHSLTYNK